MNINDGPNHLNGVEKANGFKDERDFHSDQEDADIDMIYNKSNAVKGNNWYITAAFIGSPLCRRTKEKNQCSSNTCSKEEEIY